MYDTPYRGMTTRERFWSKVDRSGGPESCWEWQAARNWRGYGRFAVKRVEIGAHRVAYMMDVGPIPDGLHLDHLCRNTSCVNPAHLEAVSPRENYMRGEGVGALNAAKTECLRGHEFTPENTRFYAGKRHCRTCMREYMREWRANGNGRKRSSPQGA